MGGGRSRASASRSPTPPIAHAIPPPSFPRAFFVIPAQAGMTRGGRNDGKCDHAPAPAHSLPSPNASLPPSRGEVRWGVGGPARPPAALHHPRAPFSSFLRRQEPRRPPTSAMRPHISTAFQRGFRAAAERRRWGATASSARVPACAGMTKERQEWRVRLGVGDWGVARRCYTLAGFHPPPNLPPGRGEG